MIKIEKNIAPKMLYNQNLDFKNKRDIAFNPGPPSKYPFANMVIGDSFRVDGMHYADLKSKANKFSKTKAGQGMHFAVEPDDSGSRCWLVGIDND